MNKVLVTYRFEERAVPYLKALEAAGLKPVKAKAGAELPSFDDVKGVLLTGGDDLNPERYGQARHENTLEVDDERDAMEFHVLEQALALNLPVLCICRGMQLLNVHCGGTLLQDIPDHRIVTPEDTGKPVHTVLIAPDSKLEEIFEQPQVNANSRHHQAIDQLGKGLKATALAPDGTIEGLELTGSHFVVGVQWHPEDQVPGDAANQRLFDKFAKAVVNY